ncbi:hypothetical protein [Streptomyces cadmiisoli]|uniref:hypothetical protein n=1 Tax=Streptomyces cadmiisoli TaxID=2184053 RepID=UPI00365DA1EF
MSTSSQPLDAGVNPAHIPGLSAPEKPAVSEDAVEPDDAAPEEHPADTADGEAGPAGGGEEAADREAGADSEADGDIEAGEDSADAAADGPVFEAADRRARIVADRSGVRLSLDDERCEFRWDEIGAVETESPRFGKRFTVTVHTPDRRWYPIEIEADAKSRHQEWDTALDAVLDAYFEDGE